MEEARLIGICGGSGSGKTTIVHEISNYVADIIIPEGGRNENALRVLVSFVKDVVG